MTASAVDQLALFAKPGMLRDRYVPPVGGSVITPRPYQRAQHAAVNRELEAHRSTLVVGATGVGKTILIAMQALEHWPMLVLAQEKSPIDQAAQKLRHVTGHAVEIEKADLRAYAGARYVVASVQSLRGERLVDFLHRFPPGYFKRIAVDEAHHALADTYRLILAAYAETSVFGLTATPDRGDGLAMGAEFEIIAHRYDLWEAIRDGWLAPLDWYPLDVTGVDLDRVRVTHGDLDEGQLDAQVAPQAAQIAQALVQHCKGLRTIVYAPGVQTAIVAAAALNEIEPGSAWAIHGGLSDKAKEDIKAGHKRGDFPYLAACDMLIEAYDDERLRIVVSLKKTRSRARFAQMPGRVTRPWPGTVDQHDTPEARRAAIAASPKPRAIFFDAQYGHHGHTLAGPSSLLGGRYPDEVHARADENLGKKGGGDVEEALEQAVVELEHERERKVQRDVKRAARAAAKAEGDVILGTPLTDEEMFGPSLDLDTSPRPFDLAGFLARQGIEGAAAMPVERQRDLRKKLAKRRADGLGSVKQVRMLKNLGVPEALARAATAKRCGLTIGKLRGRHWTEADRWMLITPSKVPA